MKVEVGCKVKLDDDTMMTNIKRKLLYIYLPCPCGSPFDFYNIKSFEYISRLLGLGVRVECADYSVVSCKNPC